MTKTAAYAWQVLDVSSVPVEEFAAALHTLVPTLGWMREITAVAPLRPAVRLESRLDPPLPVACFSLQRGFSNPLLDRSFRLTEKLTAQITAQTANSSSSPLVCTSPFYASVAERWPGPVIYYSTDLTVAYEQLDPRRVLALDRRLCAVSTLVCPNSKRIAEYLQEQAGCAREKISCLPNATRASNVLESFSERPSQPPADLSDLPRPIAGVIGNLAANLDWVLLEEVVQRAPWLSWAFVGPSSMSISDGLQRQARTRLLGLGGRIRFVGAKPYGVLKEYARSLDVAVLPYLRREPTFSGSPTRFYEHLAACRPMIATRGVAQLISNQPLVKLMDHSAEMLAAM